MKQRRDHIELIAPFGAAGSVTLPGSKSISNRVLLLAALAEGKTEIAHLLASDDTRYMLDALKTLGVEIDEQTSLCTVTGTAGSFATRQADLFLGNAGTAIRPLTAVLAVASGNYHLSGVARMHERPIGDLVEALCAVGATIRYAEKEGYPPLQIGPGEIDLSSPVHVRGDVSSQFLTALLLALPLTQQDAVIRVDGELVSRPYVEITLNLMARFGVNVARDGWREFRLAKGSRYRSPGRIRVEGDASGASYFLAAGALGGGPVRVNGVGRDSIQGDVRFSDALVELGAQIDIGEEWIEAQAPEHGQLKAFDLDLNHIPDAAMTLAVVALFCNGTSKLRNIANWRVKETDRLAAMASELRKLGALVKEGEDFLEIKPPDAISGGASIDTYDDHRIAMCFSLAALSGVSVRINDPDCVAKTYPDYFEHFARLIEAPVIAIDGPSGSGKGTVAKRVAEVLGFHYLDSGALYRLVALHAQRTKVAVDDTSSVATLARDLPVEFRDSEIYLDGERVTDAIRAESVSEAASRAAQIPEVREALMKRQRHFRRAPGLVAEGRDMASVVFPEAALKVYLTASAEARADRRYKQLIEKGLDANLATLLRDIRQRDARDSGRSVAPLQKSADAQVLETTDLSIDEGVDQVIRWFSKA
ncbi:MAG: bifunctional 3-phosphoshikimate 1-carboxyvinyltransferase/cytidylate kinase [Betaproteobacteria bacterium]|nr:MAG: bifunctional 3-phosphoshikimate 1-carboxyvinyltransferase/cytidylate kinase [Betaproteobacteria bacterium]